MWNYLLIPWSIAKLSSGLDVHPHLLLLEARGRYQHDALGFVAVITWMKSPPSDGRSSTENCDLGLIYAFAL